jgi:hypothetical protein
VKFSSNRQGKLLSLIESRAKPRAPPNLMQTANLEEGGVYDLDQMIPATTRISAAEMLSKSMEY